MHMPRSKTPAGPTTPPSLDSVRFRLPLAAERRLPTTIQHFRAQSRSLHTCSSRASRATITGIAREIRYQPADGLWLDGTFTHWLVITNFMETTIVPNPKVSVMSFFLAHATHCSAYLSSIMNSIMRFRLKLIIFVSLCDVGSRFFILSHTRYL